MEYLIERSQTKILIIIGYGEVYRVFNEEHPNKNVSKSTVVKTKKICNEAGRVKKPAKAREPKLKTNEDNSCFD